ncbi:MAG: hypothetical protein DRQ51_10545 [Gammaproteobacteria bacterium]|nr:MAG: hypothetical protein DRQ51_10545 [Gammaproteobacteria bacterium]
MIKVLGEEQIMSLDSKLLARYLRLTDLMINFGSNLGLPHTKALGQGLFELRLKSPDKISRVFYCTRVDKKIVILDVLSESLPNY